MTPAAKCKRLATMLRVKAELERDPEIRAEWKCIPRAVAPARLSSKTAAVPPVLRVAHNAGRLRQTPDRPSSKYNLF